MVLIEPSIGTLISHHCTGRRFDGRRLQIGKPATSCFRRHFKSPAEDAPGWISCESYRRRPVPSGHSHMRPATLLNDKYPLKCFMHRNFSPLIAHLQQLLASTSATISLLAWYGDSEERI
jgi:hypothetical protein